MIKFKKVRVLGVTFGVSHANQQKLAEMGGSPNVIGLCDDLDDQLYISSGLKLRAEKRTFVHEWAHAVKGVMGLNQTIDPVVAECICQSFANAFLELLEQKEIMAYLVKNETKRK
jgi:hypothetical protein